MRRTIAIVSAFQEDRIVEISRLDLWFVVQIIDYQKTGPAHSRWQRLGTYR